MLIDQLAASTQPRQVLAAFGLERTVRAATISSRGGQRPLE
jgi:hypothetical protein